MTILYQVKEWEKHFESAKSKSIKIKRFMIIPNKQCGLGYRKLLKSKNGPALYGAWCAMLNVLSRQEAPRHGYLTDTGKPDGIPLTFEDLSLTTDIPAQLFLEMISLCSSKTIGWIDSYDLEDTTGIPRGYLEDTTGIPSILEVSPNLNQNLNQNQNQSKSTSPNGDCPYDEILSVYHEVLPELPKVQTMSYKRKRWLNARWSSNPECKSIEWWKSYFMGVRGSDFLMGRIKDKKWRADFEWLITEGNFIKVIEGRYRQETRSKKIWEMD